MGSEKRKIVSMEHSLKFPIEFEEGCLFFFFLSGKSLSKHMDYREVTGIVEVIEVIGEVEVLRSDIVEEMLSSGLSCITWMH